MGLMAMSISGTVLILVILAVRAGLKGRLPKRTFAALWTVALLRLLLPFSVPSPWSVYTLLQNAAPGIEQVRYFTNMISGNQPADGKASDSAGPSRLSGLPSEAEEGSQRNPEQKLRTVPSQNPESGNGLQNSTVPGQSSESGIGSHNISGQAPQSESGGGLQDNSVPGIQSSGQTDSAGSSVSGSISEEALPLAERFAEAFPLLKGIWAAGFLLCAVSFAWMYFRCYREFRMSLPFEDRFLESWRGSHPLWRKLSIRQSDQIRSPLSYGVWHPVILLPKSVKGADRFRLRYVLEHEYVHIRYFDAAAKLLMAAALCMHWFNPCVYLMYIFSNRDLELACDEAVVRRFGEEQKSAYAMALIEMEEEKSGLLPLGNSFSKNAIEERIGAIMKMKKTQPFVHGLSAALVCGIILLFATSCGSYGEAEKNVEAGLQAEAVDVEETKANSGITTKSLSAALKDSERGGTAISQSVPDLAEESMAGYSRKELEGRIADLDRLAEEKEGELEQTGSAADALTREIEQIREEKECLLSMEWELELETFFEEHYGKYGIRYDLSEGRLYKGKTPVRFFIDEREGGVLWADNEGEAVVRAVYDKEGNVSGVSVRQAEDGKTGVHIASDQEETAGGDAEKAKEAVAVEVEKAIAQGKAEAEAMEQAEKTAMEVEAQIAEAAREAEVQAAEAAEEAEMQAAEAAEKAKMQAAEAAEEAKGRKQAEQAAEAAEVSAGSDRDSAADSQRRSAAYAISIGKEFAEYEKFGLSYDKKTDFLMYKNQTVGYFKDETEPNVYTRLVEGSGKLGIIVNRDKSGKITGFSVFPFDESSLQDSPVDENTAAKEGSGLISQDDSGNAVSAVLFPAAEQDGLEAYAVEQGTADDAGDGAVSGETAYSEGDPDEKGTSLPKEYEKFGIKVSDEKNNQWTYQGKGVAVIYDKDHWIYTNGSIPEKKAVYLKVVRDKKDRVTGLEEVSKKEIQKLVDGE